MLKYHFTDDGRASLKLESAFTELINPVLTLWDNKLSNFNYILYFMHQCNARVYWLGCQDVHASYCWLLFSVLDLVCNQRQVRQLAYDSVLETTCIRLSFVADFFLTECSRLLRCSPTLCMRFWWRWKCVRKWQSTMRWGPFSHPWLLHCQESKHMMQNDGGSVPSSYLFLVTFSVAIA